MSDTKVFTGLVTYWVFLSLFIILYNLSPIPNVNTRNSANTTTTINQSFGTFDSASATGLETTSGFINSVKFMFGFRMRSENGIVSIILSSINWILIFLTAYLIARFIRGQS